ncbi:MAG: HEAT repeat domain-containing protein [Candidatus Kariarchaeaceae archaeon]
MVLKSVRQFIAVKRIKSDNAQTKMKGYQSLARNGSKSVYDLLFQSLSSDDWNIRTLATIAFRSIISNDESQKPEIEAALINTLETGPLATKLSIIPVLAEINTNEIITRLLNLLAISSADIQYAIVNSLKPIISNEYLEGISEAAKSYDFITRRAAFRAWVTVTKIMTNEEKLRYLPGYIHVCLSTYIEIKEIEDEILYCLEEADNNSFPAPEDYSEEDLAVINELLEINDYDPFIYQRIHKLVIPRYC